MPSPDFIRVDHVEPHAARGRQLLAAHPELRALAGTQPTDRAVGRAARRDPMRPRVVARTAAVVRLAAGGLHRRCDHRSRAVGAHPRLLPQPGVSIADRQSLGGNRREFSAGLYPGRFPSAEYHLLHHRHMGDMDLDAGVPGTTESRVIGGSRAAKTAWLAGYIFVQGVVRPRRLRVRLLDGWTMVNIVVQFAFLAAIVLVAGWAPVSYLAASTVFAIGLHPLGARWIQEHFALAPDQETYSYYGPLNKVSFNVGYHNEHHDLVTVPWSRLPLIRRIAPEFYDPLLSYSSWTSLPRALPHRPQPHALQLHHSPRRRARFGIGRDRAARSRPRFVGSIARGADASALRQPPALTALSARSGTADEAGDTPSCRTCQTAAS